MATAGVPDVTEHDEASWPLGDADPWLALAWRGRTREQILDRFRAGCHEPVVEEVAPWWPFAPGPLPALGGERPPPDPGSAGPDEADLVLDAPEPLDVLIGKAPFVELVRPAYNHIVAPGPDHAL